MDKKCGTTAGYKAHRRRHEIACDDCKLAINKYNKSLVAKYPDKRLNSVFKHSYNITLEQYNQMLENQNGVCYICQKPEEKRAWQSGKIMRLAVDHDHSCCPGDRSCGKCVRGLLCHMCNTMIGLLEENGLLARVNAYLKAVAMVP
jgi:hypothetical protein